jgi:hypothetical protein
MILDRMQVEKHVVEGVANVGKRATICTWRIGAPV